MLFSELMCFICIHLIDRVALEIGLGLVKLATCVSFVRW